MDGGTDGKRDEWIGGGNYECMNVYYKCMDK